MQHTLQLSVIGNATIEFYKAQLFTLFSELIVL